MTSVASGREAAAGTDGEHGPDRRAVGIARPDDLDVVERLDRAFDRGSRRRAADRRWGVRFAPRFIVPDRAPSDGALCLSGTCWPRPPAPSRPTKPGAGGLRVSGRDRARCRTRRGDEVRARIGGAAALLLALLGRQGHFADAHRGRSDLDALVLAAELQRLLQRQLPVRDQPHQLVARGRRMLVSFFSLVGFTSRSSAREFSPTIMPSYTSVPGATNSVPRSCRLNSA